MREIKFANYGIWICIIFKIINSHIYPPLDLAERRWDGDDDVGSPADGVLREGPSFFASWQNKFNSCNKSLPKSEASLFDFIPPSTKGHFGARALVFSKEIVVLSFDN